MPENFQLILKPGGGSFNFQDFITQKETDET